MLNVYAHDADIGLNGLVTYSIVPNTQQQNQASSIRPEGKCHHLSAKLICLKLLTGVQDLCTTEMRCSVLNAQQGNESVVGPTIEVASLDYFYSLLYLQSVCCTWKFFCDDSVYIFCQVCLLLMLRRVRLRQKPFLIENKQQFISFWFKQVILHLTDRGGLRSQLLSMCLISMITILCSRRVLSSKISVKIVRSDLMWQQLLLKIRILEEMQPLLTGESLFHQR